MSRRNAGKHRWPSRQPTERRIHPRVKMSFPLSLRPEKGASPVPATSVDIGLGGLRVVCERYMTLFARPVVIMDVPITDRDGASHMERIEADAVVVRVDPDEEGDPGTEYTLHLSFSMPTETLERKIGTFLLQVMLFDPDAEWT